MKHFRRPAGFTLVEVIVVERGRRLALVRDSQRIEDPQLDRAGPRLLERHVDGDGVRGRAVFATGRAGRRASCPSVFRTC